MKSLLILFVVLFHSFLASANIIASTDSVFQGVVYKVDTVSAQLINKIEKLQNKVDELLKNDSITSLKSDTLGNFFIKNYDLIIKDRSKDDPECKDELKTIEIYIRDGAIFEINAITTKGESYMTNYIFLLSSWHKYRRLRLFKRNPSNIDLYINIMDNLQWIPEIGKRYFSGGTSKIILSQGNDKQGILYNSDLNSMIELNLYTDFMGLIDKADNGIIQTEAKTSIDIFNFKAINLPIFFLKNIDVLFRYSKFDESIKNYSVENLSDPTSIDKLKIDQQSYVSFGISLDLISLYLSTGKINLITGLDYSYTNILHGEDEADPINMISYKFGFDGEVLKFENFGADLSLQLNYKQMRHNSFDEDVTDHYDGFLDFKTRLYYKENKTGNKYFIRFNNVKELSNSKFYNLLQFGYSISLAPSKPK
ncbi:hypothetical protein [Saccharicrinis fermentans]|nr:hypothetical protein [Saccharicrinis fermentans]